MFKLIDRLKIIYIFTGIVVLTSFLYFFEGSSSKQVVIYFESVGFNPKILHIKKGDLVIFKTKLEKDFWPASDLHPTHKIYPEFDPQKPVKPEESWGFRFEKEGAWEYHNHLDSEYKGTIVVGDKDKITIDCNLESMQQKCWQIEIENKMKSDGVEAALELVVNKYGKDPQFASDCHGFAHVLGDMAYDKYKSGDNFALTFEDASICGYGFYHGFMEKALQSGGNLNEINNFCQKVGKTSPLSVSKACYHGMGHGTVKFFSDRHPEGFKDNANTLTEGGLDLCHKVTADYGDTYDQCANGVFMEISNEMVSHENNLSINSSFPFNLCEIQKNNDKRNCYGQMYGVIYNVTHSLEKGIALIGKIPEDDYAQEAMADYAGMAATRGDHYGDIQACRGAQKRLRSFCFKGLALDMVFRGTVGGGYKSALQFCLLPLLFSTEQKLCVNDVLGYSAVSQSPENHKLACDLVKEADLKANCRQ